MHLWIVNKKFVIIESPKTFKVAAIQADDCGCQISSKCLAFMVAIFLCLRISYKLVSREYGETNVQNAKFTCKIF